MEEMARVLTRHPPSDQRPAALPAQMTAQQALHSVRAETLAKLVSSLIVDGRPPGLVTAIDLRDRVLAAGLDLRPHRYAR